MFKTPISFKGPLGQLEKYFQETEVFKAYKMLANQGIANWRFNEESHTSYASITDEKNNTYQVSLVWPLQQPLTASCYCMQEKICHHVIALALYNKSKLDRIAPFTQQIRALKHVSETFANWLNQQHHDPFPNMARHRLIYILNEHETGAMQVSLYKAYLTQEDKFEVKAKIDSSVYFKKVRPKFISLADQHVLQQMNQLGLLSAHTFIINQTNHEDLLLAILKTQRCFWKACYRPPISLSTASQNPDVSHHRISEHLFYVTIQNQVLHIQPPSADVRSVHIPPNQLITPRLTLKTRWQELHWQADFLARIDWAAITFLTKDHEFSMTDIAQGRFQLTAPQVESIAAFCYQIEKLPSIYSKFEGPVSEQFDINDRYLPTNFTAVAPLLLVLSRSGWEVLIDDDYRLNSQKVSQVYVKVQAQNKQLDNGWFDVEVGVKVGGEAVNILPYLIKAIKTGQFESIKEELMIKLEDGQFIDMPKAKVSQILATINELYDDKLLNKSNKISMNQHQLLRLAEIKTADHATDQPTAMSIDWLGTKQLAAKISSLSAVKALPAIAPPDGLNATLRPYQLIGVAWLQFLADHDFHGILADDMGLGKTLTSVDSFINVEKQQ